MRPAFRLALDKLRSRRATCKVAEDDCLERRNSIRPRVPSRVAYKAERGGNEPFWSPWTMYPRVQERRRNREVAAYLPALGGDEARLGPMIIDHALRAIRQNGFWVKPSERVHACSDPDDDILLECAQAAHAN